MKRRNETRGSITQSLRSFSFFDMLLPFRWVAGNRGAPSQRTTKSLHRRGNRESDIPSVSRLLSQYQRFVSGVVVDVKLVSAGIRITSKRGLSLGHRFAFSLPRTPFPSPLRCLPVGRPVDPCRDSGSPAPSHLPRASV